MKTFDWETCSCYLFSEGTEGARGRGDNEATTCQRTHCWGLGFSVFSQQRRRRLLHTTEGPDPSPAQHL
ncbi:hypothetical protein EYF80_046244 [Liparis tanakae]|uniref:Uncharacterized protein n=1 Tax=Liparis tanakae TaxID=230148 RepID=A0A4Z2FRG3_9TELE|nr:hypothetical protein EYF80_046244 [Liparis tanakae]